MKKKKSAATTGVVLHKINDRAVLRPWADYLAGEDPWKKLNIGAERLLARWSETAPNWQFFSAATPKASKMPGFEHEHGLVVFSAEHGRSIVEEKLKGPLPNGYGDGGYVGLLATKVRHKGTGKYLLSAVERVISEKARTVYLFVTDFNHSAQRFYKSMGYEEIARATDPHGTGHAEILMAKKLAD